MSVRKALLYVVDCGLMPLCKVALYQKEPKNENMIEQFVCSDKV